MIASPDSVALRDSIKARIATSPGATVAVSYVDLETGESVSINEDTVFHAASTMKIPVMIEVLRRAQSGSFSLDQGVLLVNQFASIVDGSPYSLDACCAPIALSSPRPATAWTLWRRRCWRASESPVKISRSSAPC
jgi:beta-lactamase class A